MHSDILDIQKDAYGIWLIYFTFPYFFNFLYFLILVWLHVLD